jgi:tetratricopeptide (TPR) repeat protein
MDFILHGTPAQRLGVISGLSGEGKTTLLMRAAWEAARQGLPVLWRHYGHVTQPYEHPFEQDGPLLICLDELPYVDELPALLSDLNESGLPFVLLGTARLHEWYNSPLRPEVERRVTVQEFRLERLDEREARALLERLEANNALGALQAMSPPERLDYLLDRLQADGQLLPALMTSRAGRSFEAILETVFTNLEKRYREERVAFLLRGYAGIALVHRFGFWISRRLLAEFLPCPEAELTPRLLSPLRGELTEITEEEAGRLSTRHPWIAERALGLLAGSRLPEERYLYQDLFAALGRVLGADPGAEERKLTTKLPLAFKYQGRIAEARRLFHQATQANPKDPVSWQAWALLEKEQGRIDEARRLFQQATQANPKDAVSWQAWALLEKEQGNIAEARRLFQQATQANPKDAVSWQAWALLEKEQGRIDEARRLFQQAIQADPKNAPTLQAWALLEKEQGRIDEARRLFQQATQANPKDPVSWQAWALLEKEQGTSPKPAASSSRPARPTPNTPPSGRPGRSWKKSRGTSPKPDASSSRPSRPTPNTPPSGRPGRSWKKSRDG